ncbi:MAG TPA: hypothetical protein PKI93_00425 [Alphaproteobacteria bacterium]|nr:hypothetical protein [Alphaproteobacteria bacterium]HNS43783.1 hypothetical protein [Alphaproteobacteria bacterium]
MNKPINSVKSFIFVLGCVFFPQHNASAAPSPVNFTVSMNESVNVTGCPLNCPRIAVTVGGLSRYASYSAGSGTSSLTFSYTPTVGDLDLDGVTLSSPVDLNGGSISDLNGNAISDLTFTVPNSSGIKIDYPSLSLDFMSDRYTYSGSAYTDLTSFLGAVGGTFSRSTTATYYDATGQLQTASANEPRFNYDPISLQKLGLMVEESSTNYVPNSQFTGAAVGVPPPNITISGGGAGVTASVSAVGTYNGENYMEVTFTGTSAAAGTIYPSVNFITNNTTSAATGESWTQSLHIISYTGTSPQAFNMELGELDAAKGFLTASYTPLVSGSYLRASRTLSNANTTYIRFMIYSTLTNGQSINRTIRFSVPQLEKLSYQTSYIPTTGTTKTRGKEDLTVLVGSWFNAATGTLYTKALNGGDRSVAGLSALQTDSNNRITLIRTSTLGIEHLVNVGGVIQALKTISGNGDYLTNAGCVAYEINNVIGSVNGSLTTNDTSVNIPSITKMLIGSWGAGGYLNGHIQSVKYYPQRAQDTQVQLLTQ